MTRKAEALRRLGVKLEDVERCPQISDIIKRVMGGPKKAIEALRFSNETCAVEFFLVYDAIPVGDRDYLPLEAIALKADVSPAALLGATMVACKSILGQESALMAMTAHPEVLKSTILFAGLPGGDRDRKMLHEAVGFLPTPKGGGNMSVSILNGNPQLGAPKAEDDPEDDGFAEMFPSINGRLEGWSEDRRKLLKDGK